ncbi:16S rRNA (guanine(966)-N(2))-methyltransferase RsmD [Bombilactobacillus bombi]|uniref:16S rRNA (guanine(966)-N(2))-methyltransferase RsmD n=1 Tax=Bombilactobacillus bombi TaxID=1303590 RepID=UPI0015E5B78A|nr:16S rRNA (guanine(966)-N(2))-methyltransferase RsmD [Bombilactobacillus bombi]MBA1434323.1 16S rRNA (guanine(966)-N(2))-methyltransferase RsmD [Bombilactobacillus bombi]
MRVVAGDLRGLALTTVNGRNTRPTAAKVKEAMFNILSPYLENVKIGVDLFSGSGALGIEAVSRGVLQMYLVDKNRAAIAAIKTNVQKTHQEDAFNILPISAAHALQHFSEKKLQFDLLILDPPYAQKITPVIVQKFIEQNLLNSPALILLETDYSLADQRRNDCAVLAAKKYGQTYVEIWQYEGDE